MNNNDYKNIIIDVRDNKSGTDMYFKLFSIFSNKNIIHELRWFNLFNETKEKNSFEAICKGTDKKYNKFLLVNRNVFSGVDSFARLCKKNIFAKVIGEKTRGEGFGMTPLILNLNTKIPLMIRVPVETPINGYNKIDYENEYSVLPDIVCLSSEALEVTLDIIKESKIKNDSCKV